MQKMKTNNLTPPAPRHETASACQEALGKTCKALKAFSFYPKDHPLREQLLHGAYQAMANLTEQGSISLIVQRNGFTFADREVALENTPMTKALAEELFARELQRLTFLPELSLGDFTEFLSLSAMVPQKISAAGGMAALLTQSGVRTVIADEIDITAVFTRKKAGEAANEAAGADAGHGREPEPAQSPSRASSSDQANRLSIEELLANMRAETGDDAYRSLARLLLAKAQPLKLERDFDRLWTILVAMVEQHADPTGSAARRDCALIVLRQVSFGEMTEHLLNHLEAEDFGQKELVCLVLNRLGAEVVDAVIGRLLAVGSKSSRKSLMIALVRIGPPAQPALTGLLNDGRWQVVHTAVAILGELGNRDAVKALALTASHCDSRVRLESIRSLARIGGMEATALLLGLLRDGNQALGMQAIACLGNTRNQAALQPLLQLVVKRDLLGKTHPLKKEALQAIGRIGDRRALDPLIRLVKKRYWILPGRWHELKLLAVEAIGNLGGEQARLFLEDLSALSRLLGPASRAALEAMAQKKAEHHD